MSGGGGFGLHFGRLLVTLGSLCQVFFKIPDRDWNLDGHLGDQTWMTGSAFRYWSLWLNTIVSKGRRVWEEGGEKSPPIGRALEYRRFFGGGSKSVAGAIL